MNYFQPRQIESGPNAGKWHYTCKNDDRIWPVGNCSTIETCPVCEGRSAWWSPDPSREECAACDSRAYVDREHPCPGHDTPEEAYAHQREYELDHVDFSRAFTTEPWGACEAKLPMRRLGGLATIPPMRCAKRTANVVGVGPGLGQQIHLCDYHLNREGLASAYEGPGDVISS